MVMSFHYYDCPARCAVIMNPSTRQYRIRAKNELAILQHLETKELRIIVISTVNALKMMAQQNAVSLSVNRAVTFRATRRQYNLTYLMLSSLSSYST